MDDVSTCPLMGGEPCTQTCQCWIPFPPEADVPGACAITMIAVSLNNLPGRMPFIMAMPPPDADQPKIIVPQAHIQGPIKLAD